MNTDKWDKKITEDLIWNIQHYPSLFKSHLSILKHIILGYGSGYEWCKGECLYHYGDEKEEKKTPPISREYAEHVFKYGYQRYHEVYSNFSENYSPLFNIPEDITPEWLQVIREFVREINNLDEKSYKTLTLAYYIKVYGIHNPNCYTWYDRAMKDFEELRKYTYQLAKDRDWKESTYESVHDENKNKQIRKEVSSMIQKILDEADGIIPGAHQQLNERDARDFVRRYGKDVFLKVINEKAEKTEGET